MDFGKLVTAAVTPFDEQLKVDLKKFELLLDHLIDTQKNDAIVVCGTTGESPTLSDEEKLVLFETAVSHAAGRCKIIAGTGSYDTAYSIHMTKKAETFGVDGVLLVAPYYNRPSDEGLYRHFKAIAESTKLSIMLYNIPSRTGVNVPVSVTLKLASEHSNIVASKEAHGDLDHITKLVAGAPEGFRVYSGDDSLTMPFLSVGAYGIVSVASHVIGAEMKEMIGLFTEGKVREAAALHAKLHPVFKGLFECPHRVPNPAPVKYALKVKGLDVGGLRLPLVGVNEAEAAFIRELFS